jgi:APA family basic amino acid/polyamine antiporter
VTAAVVVCAVVLVADLREAIGFSSFAILTYYALANASAYVLSGEERRWPRWLAALGVVLCAGLAFTLPLASVAGGAALLGTGVVVWLLTRSRRREQAA